VTTLKEDLGEGGTGSGQPASGPARPGTRSLWRFGGLVALVGRHRLFSLALAAAVVPRVIATLGFQPAVLFRLDTYDYLWGAVHFSPNLVNPSGYSVFLRLLLPFHSIVLVVVIQHLLGLVAAGMVYALLRRYGLPSWGATLAAAPVLFDPAQFLIEQFIMADLLSMVLMVMAFAVLLMRDSPSVGRIATAGLLMGASATIRPTTLPLVMLIPVYLLIHNVGWRKAGAGLAAGALPVVAYMGWFDAAHGSFNMSNSNGLFLWSRTMSFANCGVIKPPADLRALCPENQPPPLAVADPSRRPLPKKYLWNHDAWQWQPSSQQFVPDTAAFTQANNSRALQFAIKAIAAQPMSYVGVIARESVRPFTKTNSLRFPTYQPATDTLTRADRPYAIGAVVAYTGNTQGVSNDLGYAFGTRVEQPFAFLIRGYQRYIFLPGPLFAAILLVGLAGLLIPRRRTAAAAYLWVSALIIMILPTAEHEYVYRYVIPTVPLVCIAAALTLRKTPVPAVPGSVPGLAPDEPVAAGLVPAEPADDGPGAAGAVAVPKPGGQQETPANGEAATANGEAGAPSAVPREGTSSAAHDAAASTGPSGTSAEGAPAAANGAAGNGAASGNGAAGNGGATEDGAAGGQSPQTPAAPQ
jgi:hypothetical protein